MLNKIIENKLLLIGIHIVIGYLATFSFFPKIFGFLCIIVPIFFLISQKNFNEEALVFSAYIVGAEVFLRMTNSLVFYESGKYAVILFLTLGFFLGRFNQRFGIHFLFYLFLLFIGVFLTSVPEGESIRKAIVFNLSGPLVLGISGIYFYKRKIAKENLLNSLFSMLLPLFSTVTYLYFRTPDIKEIIFGGAANFETSGGFGPNQVATVIGVGIFIISIFILIKKRITGFVILDVIFLMYFIYRGLLTFSRGGIITGIVVLIVFAVFYIISNKNSLKVFIKYLTIGVTFSMAIWVYTSGATGGMLDNRYAGKNASGVQKEDITSGRVDILETQILSFVNNPLGIGVGNGKYRRQDTNEHVTAVSHNEAGRLIEEHGIFGLIILVGLIIIPFSNIWFSTNYQRGYLIAFYLIWFLTINHSAMRIALPGFIYALSLIIITKNEEE
ncbi:O-antigen ligase family protein [Polaribacter gochangensis]|uniref:O-antigen ligase family protein n=1 Tax=Polaribacter gochangensis TaxID=3252903 RepID=UPI003904A60C